MRIVSIFTLVSIGVLFTTTGCGAPAKSGSAGAPDYQPALRNPATPTPPAKRVAVTAENNPTTLAGRGEPSLDDQFRPAAWIYIDGKAGHFVEKDGNPQVQWVIDEPVSRTPTFRAEAFPGLLGTPTGFRCIIQTLETEGGPAAVYSYRADDGSFEVGKEYSLVNPGGNFSVRNRMTGDDVNEIPPLVPGIYLLVAGLLNEETGTDALAITHFTVGK